MLVTLEEARLYLRVDNEEEDDFIVNLIDTAEQMVMDIARVDNETLVSQAATTRVAILYAVAFLFENREKAEYHELTMMLRTLLFGVRNEVF